MRLCCRNSRHRDQGDGPVAGRRLAGFPLLSRPQVHRAAWALASAPSGAAPASGFSGLWSYLSPRSAPFSRTDPTARVHMEILGPGVSLLLGPTAQTFFSSFVKNSMCFHSTTVLTSLPVSCPRGPLQLRSEFSLGTFPF